MGLGLGPMGLGPMGLGPMGLDPMGLGSWVWLYGFGSFRLGFGSWALDSGVLIRLVESHLC